MSIQTEQAVEGSNIVLKTSFYNADDQLITPSSVSWSLFDKEGNIVNDKRDEEVPPAEQVRIVIYGADLPDPAGEKGFYVETVITAHYTESGVSGVPEVKPVRILIEDVPTEAA